MFLKCSFFLKSFLLVSLFPGGRLVGHERSGQRLNLSRKPTQEASALGSRDGGSRGNMWWNLTPLDKVERILTSCLRRILEMTALRSLTILARSNPWAAEPL